MKPVYIARATEVAARSLDGEMMIMSAKDSTLFTLNPIGTVIWQSADGKTTLAEIVEQKIYAEFEVDSEAALKDAESFVNNLASHGILVVSGDPISARTAQRGPDELDAGTRTACPGSWRAAQRTARRYLPLQRALHPLLP